MSLFCCLSRNDPSSPCVVFDVVFFFLFVVNVLQNPLYATRRPLYWSFSVVLMDTNYFVVIVGSIVLRMAESREFSVLVWMLVKHIACMWYSVSAYTLDE